MNIISNSCVGSRIYEIFGEEFSNPFMWNVIQYKDFRELILNYHNINFKKFETSVYRTSKDSIAKTIFDDKINVYYIHYHQNNSYEKPTKVNIDIYSNDIVSYTNNKIKNRVERLLNKNEEPIFIYETRDRPKFNAIYDNETINDFINLKTQYTKMLITSDNEYKGRTGIINDCYVLYFNDKRPNLPPNTEKMAKDLCNEFKYVFEK